MIDLTFVQLILLSAAFATILKIVEAVEGHTQAFIQSDGELRYLVDGISVQLQEALNSGSTSVSFTDVDDDNLHMYASPIRFQPSHLDFKEHPVGMPLMKKVMVINLSSDTSIHMLSISGSTSDFHCSFFVEKILSPGGNTTFDVVFLGRHEGSVENTLFIHTSLGSFKYQVKASGIANPYRLKPFLGVRMPLNSSYSPTIEMHNPHSSTLQVTEMYSSGADLHLELPSGESETTRDVWEIPPFETKSVMKASFIARVENNHTAFIRIKTNSSLNGNLVLPVEVEVSSVPGIYSPIESLDFGVMRSQDEVKTLSLQLINYGQKQIHIQNVIVTPVNEAVSINFLPGKVPPDTLRPTVIATVSFDPSKALHPKQYQGKVVVKSKNSQFKITIPYHVVMLQGSLLFDRDRTHFYLGENTSEDFIFRELEITNTFNVSVIIYEYKLYGEASSFMKVKQFKSVVANPGETVQLLELELILSKAFATNSFLRLYTNISHFDLPLICYTGKMKKYVMPDLNENEINLGTLGTKEKRDIYFVLVNENPVEILLRSFRSNLTKTFVELIGVEQGNLTNVIQRQNFSGMSRSLIIKPNHYIVFRVGVTSPETEGKSCGEISVETPYEVIKLPLVFSTVMGSLNSDFIVFEKAFPGKISWQALHIHSSFLHPMSVTSVEPVPSDERFYFDAVKSPPALLKSGMKNYIGKIYFDPIRKCSPDCYTGLPVDSSTGQKWLAGLAIPPDVGLTDYELYISQWNRWQDTLKFGKNSLNVTFEVNTKELKGFRLQGQAQLHWPHLASKQKIKFPLTQIGNTTIQEFSLENPSGLPVIAQVLNLPIYSSPESVVKLLQPGLSQEILESLNYESKNVFTLQDIESFNTAKQNPISMYRKSIKEYFKVEPLNTSVALLLMPGMRVQIKIGFTPIDESFHTSLILIRNNLTILDSLVIQAKGGYGQVKFGNKKPGSLSPLQFEILEKHLKDCIKPKTTSEGLPNFTVRRSFTARNSGELPVYFHGFAINEMPCEGYGFKVLNCHSFVLQPNDSRRIDVAFTPDFTLSRIHRTLNIFSSLSPGGLILNYSLVATIPPHLMLKCASFIPRPKWEKSLMIILLCMIVMLMICVCLAAYAEGNRIISSTFLPMLASVFPCSEEYDKDKLFDLKKLGLHEEEKCKSSETQKLNNHQHLKKRTTLASETCASFLNMAFKGKKLNHWSQNNPASVEKQTPQEKDISNNNSVHTKDMESETEHIVINKCANRKKSKRLPMAEHLDLDNVPSEKNHTSNQLRRWSNLFHSQSSVKKNANDQSNGKSKENKSVDNSFGTANERNSKSKNKSKSKQLAKQESEETKLISKSRSQSQDGADEDSSSTTTESSGADVDASSDKHLSKPAEQTVTQPKTEPKSSKSKRGKEIDRSIKMHDDDDVIDDKDFELSTKSKAHRKIKIDNAKVYGGDILRPNTLELPYQIKTISSTKENKDIGSSDNKNVKTSAAKIKDKVENLPGPPDIREAAKNLPQWDPPPSYQNNDEAFTELSKQTEAFAKKHGHFSTEHPFKPPINYMRNRPTTGFTINSESKKLAVKHPGTIGQRTNAQLSNAVTREELNLLSPGTPQTPMERSSPFFSTGVYQDTSTPYGHFENSPYEKGTKNPFSYATNEPFSIKNLWDSPPLQEDDDSWSTVGLDVDSNKSPWTPHYAEHSRIWSHRQSLPTMQKNVIGESLFGSTGLSWNPVWPSTDDSNADELLSESNSGMTSSLSPIISPVSSGSPPTSADDLKLLDSEKDSKDSSPVTAFDPFRSVHQIWQPTSKAKQTEGNTEWNFSYFSNKDADN